MDAALLLLRLTLASVFIVSGVTKLGGFDEWRKSLADFALPESARPFVAAVLPAVELAIALLLVAVPTAAVGAAGALVLLLTFISVIAFNLYRGRRPDCRCFGLLNASPIGAVTIGRNIVLAAIAGGIWVLSSQQYPDPWTSISSLSAFQETVLAGGALALVLLLANVVLLQRVASQGRLAAAAVSSSPPVVPPVGHGLTIPATAGRPVGTPAPAFALRTVRGDIVSLVHLRRMAKPLVLIFSDAACAPCTALLPDIAHWQKVHQHLAIVVISRGTLAENAEKARDAGIAWLLLQKDREVAEAYEVFGTPSAVLVNPDGTLATLLAQGEAQIRELVAHAAQQSENVPSASAVPQAQGEPRAPYLTVSGEPTLPPTELPEGARPVKRSCVEDELMSDGTIVLYNTCDNKILTLNGTGALIWEFCDGEHDAESIAAALRDVFPDAETAADDVRSLLDRLIESGMIQAADTVLP